MPPCPRNRDNHARTFPFDLLLESIQVEESPPRHVAKHIIVLEGRGRLFKPKQLNMQKTFAAIDEQNAANGRSSCPLVTPKVLDMEECVLEVHKSTRDKPRCFQQTESGTRGQTYPPGQNDELKDYYLDTRDDYEYGLTQVPHVANMIRC
jgi:hypothetical protein